MVRKTGIPILVNVSIFGACLILLQACVPMYYAPNAHNVPLLKEKHELRINAGLTAVEDASGPEIQAAYAITDHLGLMIQGAYLKGGNYDTSWEGEGKIAEIGMGYFKSLGNNMVAEVYGGAGFATITNQRYEAFDLRFAKPFIQPTFGFNSKYFEFAFSPKIALVHYKEPLILAEEYVIDANGIGNYITTKQQQTFFAVEPAITIRAGWKFIKLQGQPGWSFQDIPYSRKVSFNMGLSFNLAYRYQKAAK